MCVCVFDKGPIYSFPFRVKAHEFPPCHSSNRLLFLAMQSLTGADEERAGLKTGSD